MSEQQPWHAITAEETRKAQGASSQGLTADEAASRLQKHGENALKETGGKSFIKLAVSQLADPIIYLLLAAAVISFLVGKGHHIDGFIILGVVALNTALGVIQEWRAEKALEALKKLSAPHATVIRNGKRRDIEAKEVAPGDILLISAGDRVAADARLLETNELRVDEASLTGESEPVAKHVEPVKEDAGIGDRKNMVYMSTVVSQGSGRAVVVATGMETEIGRIAGQVEETERSKTPLQKRMERLSLIIGGTAVALSICVYGLGILRGYRPVEMLLYTVAIAVSAIPEGLPAVISVTLALGVRRMSKRKAILRRMPAVETLGSTTVVCTDKTGTITQGEMTVQRLWVGGRDIGVSGVGYEPKGQIEANEEELKLEGAMLLSIGVLCNDADLLQDDDWRISGSPTESALLTVGRKAGLDEDVYRPENPRLSEVPFTSERKYMATLNEFPAENGARRILVKGASERVADYCARVMVNDEVVPLDEPWRERIDAAQDEMRANGLRVLAGAWRDVDAGAQEIHNGDVTRDLVFAGLWGLMDPPRPEAAEAIGRAQGAGMRIIMMTGDHAETASAIARQVGIATGDGQAVTGERLEAMGDEELVEALKETSVFARVSPAHKVRVTQALQAQDEVVAMTGDGVNDAAALKRASIGVAMGQKGTEVAKEAADMVLQDDNFATIIAAVEEGRLIFSNLRRVIFFLIATNIGEILTLSTGLVLGWDLPLTAVMILWVNLLTEGACTVPLGVEPSHRDHLKDPPRRPGEGILDLVTARRVAILAPIMAAGTLLLFHFRKGEGLDYARTCAFTALAAFQWFQAFNARSRYRSAFAFPLWSNRYLLIGLSIAIVLQVCTVYVPFMQTAFDTEPLRIWDWALAIGVASSILAADEILKLFHVHGREGQRAE